MTTFAIPPQQDLPQEQAQAQVSPKRFPSAFSRRFHTITSTAGRPLNKAANIVGAEGWFPSSMKRESLKAARILHSFTNLDDVAILRQNSPMHPTGLTRKACFKIPPEVLRSAAGLVIFNVLRLGHMNGSFAAGSGVVLARLPDGSWSPPSAIVVSSLGAGFALGVGLYECVCVLNTPDQVAAFTRPRVSLGGDASVAIGPVGTGANVSAALAKGRPVWSYMKSRGLWASAQVDGTVMLARADANSVAYGQRGISAASILKGEVAWPEQARGLFEVLRAADGHASFYRETPQEVVQVPVEGVVEEKGDVKVDVKVAEVPVEEQETVLDEKERLRRAGF